MLQYNAVKERKYIVFNNEPYEVISSHVFRKQQRKPVNQVKMRNLITGKMAENSFHSTEKVEEADISKKTIVYLFHKFNKQQNTDEYWFKEENKPSQRFSLSEDLIGTQAQFMKTNEPITALVYNDQIVGVTLPVKVDLKVTEAVPAVAGNTAQGATKQVTLETGASITVPLFVKQGDVLTVNTSTGEYVNRAN